MLSPQARLRPSGSNVEYPNLLLQDGRESERRSENLSPSLPRAAVYLNQFRKELPPYPLKRTNPSSTSILETLKISTEKSGDTWFGCIVDDRDQLVTSAFGPNSKVLEAHLISYSKKIGSQPAPATSALTHVMIRLYEGHDISGKIKFNNEHVSKFQNQVYRVLEQIPKGRVTTYGLISKRLGSAPRAVGGAVASNPWPLFIPCERVVNFDLTIGNYGMCGSLGPSGTITKRTLLERENVPILSNKVEPKALWDPSKE